MNNVFTKQFSFAVWILVFGILSSQKLQAQSGTVTVDFNNATPNEIITNLESRTPYRFVYPEGLDLNSPKIKMKKENASIDEILKELQSQTNLNFKRTQNNIAVNRKAVSKKLGKLSGKTVDNVGLSLPGATLRILENGFSTVTDMEGNYSFFIEDGVYTIEASFISFQTQKITEVVISENKTTTLNVALKEDSQTLNEVVITQTYKKAAASTEGMLLEQKQAAQMSDGISAEQIARTPDTDVGATLKRITGVTTIDDKFVIVRSMGERWNQAVMDGINLPSTDAGQQQFNFDIIPTAMVESIIVSKNATPDMNANFAGGYVEVRTKAIPKKNFNYISIGNSYNSESAFKERLTKQEGKYDYLGFDDGSRSFPSNLQNIPYPTTESASIPYVEQSKRFTNDNFTTYKTYGAPGTSLQFALGRSYDLNEDARWGFVGSVVFKNTQEQLLIEHTERGTFMRNSYFYHPEDKAYSTLTQYGFDNTGASYSYNSTLGGMFNAGVQWGKNKITLRNALIHIFDNQFTQITGWNFYANDITGILNGTQLPYTQEVNYPVYQAFLQNKIEGENQFGGVKVNWFAAYGTTSRDTKDATFLIKRRKLVGEDELLYQHISNTAPNEFSRGNFTNDEKNYNVGINFNYDFNFNDSFQNFVKGGYFGTYKKATNQQQKLALNVIGINAQYTDTFLSDAQLLDGSHYAWGEFGWQNFTYFGNEYIGDVKMHSPFLMIDNKISSIVRLVWGMRAESYVYTQIASQLERKIEDKYLVQNEEPIWQYLPSVNLTVSPTTKTNLRLGYNKSVIRPQFAERTAIPYVDPIRSAVVVNVPGMVSTVVDNFDFKTEWFPSRGEIFSVGVYHKNMENPIEGVTFIGGDGGSRTIYNMNSPNAKLWGIEMELYKNFSFLGEEEVLKNIFVYGNVAVNNTKVIGTVNLDGTGGEYEANRPLYGQSPYNYNLGLDYISNRLGFSVRHNAIGDQYILVGFDYDAEEIRKPYAVTDAQISYLFMKEKNLNLKLGFKNLFDTVNETYNNGNSYSEGLDVPVGTNPRKQRGLGANATDKFDEGIDRTVFKSKTGRRLVEPSVLH